MSGILVGRVVSLDARFRIPFWAPVLRQGRGGRSTMNDAESKKTPGRIMVRSSPRGVQDLLRNASRGTLYDSPLSDEGKEERRRRRRKNEEGKGGKASNTSEPPLGRVGEEDLAI